MPRSTEEENEMIKCPDCGSIDYSIVSGDLMASDKTDFCCLDCGLVFFVFNGKVFTERDIQKFEEEKRKEDERKAKNSSWRIAASL